MASHSMPRISEFACLEVKMIGKPYAGELQVRFDEGGQDFFLWRSQTGTKLETADTAKDLPNER